MPFPEKSSNRPWFSPVTLALLITLTAVCAYILIEHWQQKKKSGDAIEQTLVDGSSIGIQPGTHDTTLADLGTRPDWSMLDLWQETMTREDFLHLLTQVYTVGDTWKRYITVNEDHAVIRTDTRVPGATYKLKFSELFSEISPKRNWSSAGDLTPGTREKPLAGLHIAIDPGHIGGEFARIEGRWFKIGNYKPVKEGEMTLLTGKLIKEKLIALGARVYLIRGANKPVNPHRPEFYHHAAVAKARSVGSHDEKTITYYKNKFFYRTGEIRARARRVNLAFKPDLVLCLHYNAEAWADPDNPTLTTNNHYHVLLHGALTSDEIAHDDERFEMLVKILQRSHDEEKSISMYIAHALAQATGLPPYQYSPLSSRSKAVPGPSEGVWARNLLANRIYQCPVLFLEPYVMNNQEVHDRVQLGDYVGTRPINGVERKSIYREYADAVVLALKEYYLAHRIIFQPQPEALPSGEAE